MLLCLCLWCCFFVEIGVLWEEMEEDEEAEAEEEGMGGQLMGHGCRRGALASGDADCRDRQGGPEGDKRIVHINIGEMAGQGGETNR